MFGPNGQSWLARLHSIIASKLTDNGWSQGQISELLGTTQSTVSRWSTRPHTPLESPEDEIAIDKFANEIVSKLVSVGAPTSTMTISVEIGGISPWAASTSIATTSVGEKGDRARIISSLHQFAANLSEIPIELLPAVGTNIAVATEGAKTRQDVAAFPGRLIMNSRFQKSLIPPQFGSSKHLSALLLRLKELGGHSKAIIHLKPCSANQLKKFVESQELSLGYVPKGEVSEVADVLLDEGDFGWEPSLYITAKDTEELFHRLETLLQFLR